MDNQPVNPVSPLLQSWQGFSLLKKTLLIILGSVITLIVISIFLSFFSSARSTSLGLSNYSEDYSYGPPTVSPAAERSFANPLTINGDPQFKTDYVAGYDAEQFETSNYSATIETSSLTNTCDTISNLKPREGVVFLGATTQDTSCHFTFKVKKEETEAVVAIIKSLDPEDFTQRTNSLKKQLENSLNQSDILNQNLISIESILNEAILSYDKLLNNAATDNNASALATAIKDKIDLIDRLKTRREQTRQAIDFLNQQLAEQTDKLDYSYFSVSVRERLYIDIDNLKETWKYELEKMVRSVNGALQDLSLGLITFIVHVLLYALYLIIILVVAKYGWRIVRAIWKS